TSYYTAPTLIRSLMGWHPDGVPAEYDLSSIRLIGTVGEAVNPEAWVWARTQIGRDALDRLDGQAAAAGRAPVPRDGAVGVPMV
ncbi:acetyl-coenzyme A synthetase, partial [Belnapia sp. T6]|nr:acetyl-coenzyme A synthetase [Belnapia mucosa]